MAGRTTKRVLDAWSVLAILQGEPVGQKALNLIADCLEGGGDVLMTTVNAGEVWYNVARRRSEADADRVIEELRAWGIEFVAADWELARQAAQLKAKGKLSFADAFAAALAKQSKCELVTGDREFRGVESEVKIRWL
ncbi:MAG: type II toxin-antitoxin system VapC family toxin [Anaerolineae bacterium]|nr:type II toxin-antitoxin system VapC family toxin [Candidatus Roseilinea sp.]MDW8449198.1 type II toxin-antitoxin system VapC family toxin [Anaerolineae bacterium]